MGAGLSIFTPEQIEKLKKETPFSEDEMVQLMKRYGKYASAKGTSGMPLTTLQNFPEYIGNPLITEVFMLYKDQEKPIIYPEQFLLMCGILSPKASTERKRKLAFRIFDVHKVGFLQYEELFRMYKLIFPPSSLTDDQILDLVFRALNIDELQEKGKVTFEDFCEVISDGEIRSRFTVQLQV